MRTILIFSLLMGVCGHAADLPFEAKKCKEPAAIYLKSWNSTGEWTDLVPLDPAVQRYSSQTSKFGEWVYVEAVDGVVKKTALHSQYKMKAVEFNDECKELVREDQKPREDGAIDDQYLAALANKSRDLLVVIWSPEMVYMGRSFVELERLRKTIKIPMAFFLERAAPAAQAAALQKRYKVPAGHMKKIESFDFSMRGARTHMPVVFHFQGGRIKGAAWRGHKSVEEYQALLQANGVKL